MRAAEYVPAEDLPALEFLLNFSGLITARPGAYGVGVPDAQNIARVVGLYADALAVLRQPSGKNKVSVSLKNQSKADAIQLVRSYAMRIKMDDGVSDQDKLDVGVRPVNPHRTPVPPPETAPDVSIVAAVKGSQTVGWRDAMNPAARGKPWGVRAMELFVAVADAPVSDPSVARYVQGYGRGPVGVAFAASDDGKVATYFGRWVSTRGEPGPFGPGASMRIAA